MLLNKNNKINVLIVDDSAFMRKAIENMITKDPLISVIGHARNGKEAIELAEKLKPDVITLDIAMPVMDGLEALKMIMKVHPCAVIVVSSLTTEGAKETIDALELGAVDFITKDRSYASFGMLKIKDDLVEKIKYFGTKKVREKILKQQVSQKTEDKETQKIESEPAPVVLETAKEKERVLSSCDIGVLGIGTSTGGPQALQQVIPKLPGNIGIPVLVVQHMPPNFTKSLAERLNALSHLTVVEAQGKEPLEKNVVFIAKGGFHMKIRKIGPHFYTELTREPTNLLYIPSVDVLFTSLAENYEKHTLAVIMTGMGKDGLLGCQLIKQKNGSVIAQDEKTSIVYGMPKAVVENNLADKVVPLHRIANEIVKYCS
jgi:two-component system chemotaxis response regulator CheB